MMGIWGWKGGPGWPLRFPLNSSLSLVALLLSLIIVRSKPGLLPPLVNDPSECEPPL